MKFFRLPDLGEGLTEAEIQTWHVAAGETVKTDQPMVSVETAKAIVEVPVPRDGTIAKLLAAPGTTVAVGAEIIEFTDGEDNAASADAGSVVGNIQADSYVLNESATGVVAEKSSQHKAKAMPAVRSLAKRLNVDLSALSGSGANGAITKQDVLSAANATSGTPTPTQTKTAEIDGAIPLTGLTKAMSQTMSQSHAQIVPVTLFDDANIHAWASGTDITARIIRALVNAVKVEPALNAWFDTTRRAMKLIDEVDLGLAVDTPEGLLVANLRNVAQYNPSELREKINLCKQQMRDRTLPPSDLQGYSIMLSNFGNYCGRYATPIIVPPCMAILGTGSIREAAVVFDGKVCAHRILPLSLSFDHRGITGGQATRFLQAVIADLESSE